jgi:hypothetical protein
MYGFFQHRNSQVRFVIGLACGFHLAWELNNTPIGGPIVRSAAAASALVASCIMMGMDGGLGVALGFVAGNMYAYQGGARNILKPVAETGFQPPRPSF